MRKPETATWEWLARLPIVFRVFVCIVALVTVIPVTARAQTPREYLNIPIDELAGFVEYTVTRSQSASSAALAAPNDLTFSRLTVPYILYSFPFRGKYGGVSATMPFVRVETADGTVKSSGFADLGLAFHANLRGLPAVTREKLSTYVPRTIVSLHMTVNVPVGTHDKNAAINTGANRWAFTPLVNLNIPRKKGREWYEFYVSTRFFTANNQFQTNKRLTQKPLFMLTGHYSHNIGKKMWGAVGGTYDNGGRSSVDGVRQDNYVNGFRPQATISRLFFNRVGVSLRYENTQTSDKQSHRNSSLSIRIGSYLWTRKP